ncbi:SCP2 sterol-binding domain-containing protein [Actinomadura fulvescens]|uniref:SCP2 domain-containing protein n=1 Tax=Actinomadura fulvescens TaxID=46160 RepID=A0ABP6BUK1_9ACTN
MSDNLQGLLDQISSPKDLRALLDIEGMDDAVIDQFIGSVGAQAMLGRVFSLMATRYKPKGRLRGGIVQWEIDTPGGRHTYQLLLTPMGARSFEGVRGRPRVTLRMATPTLLHLCAGRLDPVAAFRERKIKIRGNLLFGALMPRWFDY